MRHHGGRASADCGINRSSRGRGWSVSNGGDGLLLSPPQRRCDRRQERSDGLSLSRRERLTLCGHHATRIERATICATVACVTALARASVSCRAHRGRWRTVRCRRERRRRPGRNRRAEAPSCSEAVRSGDPIVALSTTAESDHDCAEQPERNGAARHHLVRFPVKVPAPIPPRSTLPLIAVLLSISPS